MKRRRRLSQQDLKILGVQPGLLVARYSPDGRGLGRARVEQLTAESRGARRAPPKLPTREESG
jgi:hypothetical protein